MSRESGSVVRSDSPATSEASLATSRSRTIDEPFKKDKNYRRYASNIDRALSLFDSALQEWADYISFLSKLLKALQSHPPSLPIVPNRVVVSKRLAQCLNPSLPSGVHQKALEVYGYIFEMLPRDQLSQDITLYLPGIAPTLAFASLSVRPLFLSLFENYILHLNPGAIRPALKAILLSLLPGLEDETSEDFETTLRIVNEFRLLKLGDNGFDGDGTGYFWQTLFLISLTNPGRRAGVLAYLNKYFPRLGGAGAWSSTSTDIEEKREDVEANSRSVTQPEPGLLIRCFAAGLTDPQILIQRSFLDLLVTHLPLHSTLLQNDITAEDMHVLVSAAVSIVMRRDMSLNRRLWSWFLGPEASGGTDKTWDISSAARATFDSESSSSRYFGQYGLKPLVSTIKQMIFSNLDHPSERAKPFRISLSLMDRWEIGALIVPEVFLPIMRSTQQYKENCSSKAQFDEVFRSASAFFDGVESSLIFSEVLGLLHVDPSHSRAQSGLLLEDFKLTAFILNHFNIKEEEMVLVHLPLILFSLIHKMQGLSAAIDKYPETSQSLFESLNEATSIVGTILTMIPNRAFVNSSRRSSAKSLGIEQHQAGNLTIRDVLDFYKRCKESLEPPLQPISPTNLSVILLKGMGALTNLALSNNNRAVYLKEWVSSFVSMIAKAPHSKEIAIDIAQPLYKNILGHLGTIQNQLSFSAISSVILIVTSLYSNDNSKSYVTYEQLYEIVPLLVRQLWLIMSPLSPKYHVEAVRNIWLLHSLTWQHHLVQATICQLMVNSKSLLPRHRMSEEHAEKFFILWNHSHHSSIDSYTPEFAGTESKTQTGTEDLRLEYQLALLDRPLYLVLDALHDGELDEVNLLVKEWLKESNLIHNVLRVLLGRLKQMNLTLVLDESNLDSTDQQALETASQLQYVLKALSNVITASGSSGWSALTNYTVTGQSLNSTNKEVPGEQVLQNAIAEICMTIFVRSTAAEDTSDIRQLQKVDLLVLQQLLAGPSAEGLSSLNIDTFIIDELSSAVDRQKEFLLPLLIDTLFVALKIRIAQESAVLAASFNSPSRRKTSLESSKSVSRLATNGGEKSEKQSISAPQPPNNLMPCLLKGIRQSSSPIVVQKWISLLAECLPLYLGSIYQVVLTLVTAICQRATAAYHDLQNTFLQHGETKQNRAEQIAVTLLNGLDNCLAIVHERLLVEEASVPALKTPDQPQSFFGNMVSGVFSSDNSQPRSATANNRLTVILCFQDVVRLCFSIWSWSADRPAGETQQDPDSLASFQFTSLRLRNRARRILEHLFQAEALESLETLIELWHQAVSDTNSVQGKLVLNLLHTLVGSRPKFTVPAVFNAIYTRTNPNALEQNRKSSMSSHLTEADLAAFLVTYARSLDEDVLDEIWIDCTTFLKDVLTNPFPHRQILPRLMEFTVIIGEKMQHTSFGEDRKAKKELGDLLQRLLTATFTSKPLGSVVEPSTSHNFDELAPTMIGSDDIVSILAAIVPGLPVTLSETERINAAMMSISTNVISPIFHSRLYPQNVHRNLLELVAQTGKNSAGGRYFKKDVSDAFNDPKFFSMRLDLVQSHWLKILNHWALIEKDRIADLLQRIPQPTNAGIMFGVGAAAARLEADRKVQLTMRRLSVLILATEDDNFSADVIAIQQKLEDLVNATAVSSPSSVTRAEVFMVLRALVLKTSSIHLASFWPLIGDELHNALSALTPMLDNNHKYAETYNSYSILQACKLLETLLLTSPDEFQAQQWLFVNDTIDAVYPPLQGPGNDSAALADHISRVLNCDTDDSDSPQGTVRRMSPESTDTTSQPPPGSSKTEAYNDGLRRGFLNSPVTREVAKDEIIEQIVRPFFERLSIRAFESMYSMRPVDVQGCKDDLLADLFNEFTMAG